MGHLLVEERWTDGHWVNDVIRDKMQDKGINPSDIDSKRKRYQYVHGVGYFNCKRCKTSWKSYWVWVKFDLKLQRIDYTFKQKCKKDDCQMPLKPILKEDDISDMLDFILKRFDPKPKDEPPGRGDPKPKRKAPHPAKLCEKCGFGDGEPCWMRSFKKK